MFSALKSKLSNQNQANQANQNEANHGISSMNAALQKKFARGVHYNMKLLLRGDRNTGKSCLFKRLQGGQFVENYVPSEEINVASIQWNYKATDDIVKVEVWDVVDRGKKRKALDGLKLAEANSNFEQPALDAEFVDVYKGAHGVILMFDVTKAWTFDYVKKEASQVPKHLPVLILANFIDKAHHRCVSRAQAMGFIEDELDRGSNAAQTLYAESSMRNGFGLKFLHKFLNLPFLTLQKQSLLKQLETNEREMIATLQELDLFLESNEADYENYSSGVNKKRRAQAESLAPAPTIDVVVGQPSNNFKEENLPKDVKFQEPKIQASPSKPTKIDVENFMPENDAIENFLAESPVKNMSKLNLNDNNESDEEEEVNPQVASFAEDIEIDDYVENSVTNQLESSEDEEMPKVMNTKPKVKAKLSNSSSKSEGSLHFELPEHLKQPVDDEVPQEKKKKPKKTKKHKKRKSEDKERDELEEFLNGIPAPNKDEGAYEEL